MAAQVWAAQKVGSLGLKMLIEYRIISHFKS
jgi:hypothetical protein